MFAKGGVQTDQNQPTGISTMASESPRQSTRAAATRRKVPVIDTDDEDNRTPTPEVKEEEEEFTPAPRTPQDRQRTWKAKESPSSRCRGNTQTSS